MKKVPILIVAVLFLAAALAAAPVSASETVTFTGTVVQEGQIRTGDGRVVFFTANAVGLQINRHLNRRVTVVGSTRAVEGALVLEPMRFRLLD